jgi:hypothetical protein
MSTDRGRVNVGVVGAGLATAELRAQALEVGRLLAEAGAVVVTGGLGGVMAAACQGASAAGGITVGILPGGDRRDANPFLTVAIATGMGEARNALVARASGAVIALAGEHGTLSEVALALKMGRVVVGLDAWTEIVGVVPAADAREAVALALDAAGEKGSDPFSIRKGV